MHKHIMFSLLLATLLSNSSLAETLTVVSSSEVTLSSLTESVYQQDAAHHNKLATQQQINTNTALANRFFSAANTISVNHENDLLTHNDGFQEWEASIDMPLWLPGQQQDQQALSEKMSAVLPASQQKLKLDASAIVRDLVWELVINQNALQQAKQTWLTAQELGSDIAIRVESGELAGMDRLLANAHILDMQTQVMIAEAELEYSLERYTNATGKHALPEQYREKLSTKTTVEASHPSLGLLKQEIATLIAKQSLAYYDGATNPNLSLGIRTERDDDNERFSHSIALGLSFALNDDVYRKPAVADAAKELADAEIIYKNVERQLNINLSEQHHDLELKNKQFLLMIKRNETTQQYLSLQQRAFDLGEINVVSLLQSRALANKSSNQMQKVKISIQQSIAKVNQALGIIL